MSPSPKGIIIPKKKKNARPNSTQVCIRGKGDKADLHHASTLQTAQHDATRRPSQALAGKRDMTCHDWLEQWAEDAKKHETTRYAGTALT
jgi:hypothetical protein